MIEYEKMSILKEIELMPETERETLLDYVVQEYLDMDDLKSILADKAKEAGLTMIDETELESVDIGYYAARDPLGIVEMLGKEEVVEYLNGLINEG